MVSENAVDALVVVGIAGSIAVFAYFLVTGLRADHRTGEYHLTWGVGVVTLFLLGVGPGLVGLALYAAVERGYPIYWLVGAVLVALVLFVLTGLPGGTPVVAG